MPSIIGVDIGGTQIRAASFDADLNMLDRANQLTQPEQGSDAVTERIIETIRQVTPEDPGQLEGIGIGIPGPLDARAGVVLNTPNLPFEDYPIRQIVKDAFGGAVHVGNDADVAALGEYTLGAGKDVDNLIYLTISTGIGGGIIVNGKPYIGNGLAGELGHMIMDPSGQIGGLARIGDIEDIASGTAISFYARDRISKGEESILSEMVAGDLDAITARHVGDAAAQGDPLALDIIQKVATYIGAHIASLMAIFDPDMFVIGGGVVKMGDVLKKPMHAAIARFSLNERYWKNTPIVEPELGEDVGLYGAAALVRAMEA